MAQKKETKKMLKVRDLKPKKDAKGGFMMFGAGHKPQSPGHSPTGPTGQK